MIDSSDDWRSLLNFKYAEPEYQALFSDVTATRSKPSGPPSIQRKSSEPSELASESAFGHESEISHNTPPPVKRVATALRSDQGKLKRLPSGRFPSFPQPAIPESLNESQFLVDLDGMLSRIQLTNDDGDIVASLKFLVAVMGTLAGKAVESRRSIVEHAQYIFAMNKPLSEEDMNYVQSTIFNNFAAMQDDLQELSDELSLLKASKVRNIFLDEDGHYIGDSQSKFAELEASIVFAGQALHDEVTSSVITITQLSDYTQALVSYSPEDYINIGSQFVVARDRLRKLHDEWRSTKSPASIAFESFMKRRHLPVTNSVFAYLQHPEQYANLLVFHEYTFSPGEFHAIMDYFDQQDKQYQQQQTDKSAPNKSASLALFDRQSPPTTPGQAFYPSQLSNAPAKNAYQPMSFLQRLQGVVITHCAFTDKETHRLAQSFRRMPVLKLMNLAHNHLTYSAMASISTVIFEHHCCRALQLLYLDHNRINSDGVMLLSQVLGHLPYLLTVSLGHNPVGDVGAYALLKSLVNPQRRAFATFPPLLKKKKRASAKKRHHHGQRHPQHVSSGDEEEEEEEEVVLTLPTTRSNSIFIPSSSSAAHAMAHPQTTGGTSAAGKGTTGHLTRYVRLPKDEFLGEDEVSIALHSQARYPLHCYLLDYFAPSLVLETLTGLFARWEYEVYMLHSRGSQPTHRSLIKPHQYLFQQQPYAQKAAATSSAGNSNTGCSNNAHAEAQSTLINDAGDYAWVNNEVEEFDMDQASDYSDELAHDDLEAVASKMHRLYVSPRREELYLQQVTDREVAQETQRLFGAYALPPAKAFLQRLRLLVGQRVRRAHRQRQRLLRLTYRERLVRREKQALGIVDDDDEDDDDDDEDDNEDKSGVQPQLQQQLQQQQQQELKKAQLKRERADYWSRPITLEDLQEEEEDEVAGEEEHDAEDGAEDSEYDGEHEGDDEEEEGEDMEDGKTVLENYNRSSADHPPMRHRKSKATTAATVASKSKSISGRSERGGGSRKRGSIAKTAFTSATGFTTQTNKQRQKALAAIPVTTRLLLLRAEAAHILEHKYSLFFRKFLKVRVKIQAIMLFLRLRQRGFPTPTLGVVNLQACQLTDAILPALVVVLRENNCLVSMDLSHNESLLEKQASCHLLSTGLRYTLAMKSSKPKPESQQQPLAQPSGPETKASSLTLSAQNLGALNNHHRSAANASLNQKSNLVNTSAVAAGSNAHANASTNSSANKANAHYYQVWYSTSLQVLCLNHTGMRDPGLLTLSSALMSVEHNALLRLELKGNLFGPTAANVLANLGHTRYYLETMTMATNYGTSASAATEHQKPQHHQVMHHRHHQQQLIKVKPPVFSRADDDFHRDKGYLDDVSDHDSDISDNDPHDKDGGRHHRGNRHSSSSNNNRGKAGKGAKSKTQQQQQLHDWSEPVRLVDDTDYEADNASLRSFQDRDVDDEEDEEEDEDDLDDYEEEEEE